MKKITFTQLKLKTAFAIIFIVLASSSFGQIGWLDPTFGNSGVVTTTYTGSTTAAEKVEIQNDGKIVVLGTYNSGSGNHIMLTRYMPDGTLDATFGTGGISTTILSTVDVPKDMVIQSDGKIVILTSSKLARYTTTGQLDLTFDSDGWLPLPSDQDSFSLGLLSDGKIAVGTGYTFIDFFSATYNYPVITLYNDNGSVFSTTNCPNLYSYFSSIDRLYLFVQSDDKVVVCGRGDFGGGYSFRINANGTADNSYGTMGNGLAYFNVAPIEGADLQSDGKIVFVVWGSFNMYRINTSGVLETAGTSPIILSNLTDFRVLANNKILITIGNFFSTNDYTIYRFNDDATLDATFSADGKVLIDLTGTNLEYAKSIAVQSDGKYIVTGSAYDNFGTIRIDQCTPKTADDVIHLCDATSYTWIDGLTYSASNYTATHTLVGGATNGCDSIVTLKLTMGISNSSTDNQTTCSSLTWIDGNTYTSSNNTATHVLTNASGCDSTVTLNLTVNTITDQSLSTLTPVICDNGIVTISTASSEIGLNYYLRDDTDDSVIDGPIAGTGSSLDFSTGSINTTTTYNVYVEKADNSIQFDGIDDKVQVAGPNLASQSFTIEFWGKRNSTGTHDFFLGQGIGQANKGLHIGFRNTNEFTFAFFSNDLNTPQYTDFNWHHWAMTFNATNNERKIYRDGVVVASDIAAGGYIGTGILTMGDNSFGGGNVNGNMDEVRIWNSARSLTDIQSFMNTCMDGNESGLLAYYKFNETPGTTTVTDNSLNGFDGGLVNMDENTAWQPGYLNCGCSIELTDLVTITVNNSTTGTDTKTACNSYTWIDGNTYTSSNNTATHTLTNAAGCDSIVTLNLTINNSTTGTDVQTACNTFIWIDGNTYTSSNNTATHTLTNAAGCDSIVTLNLTINNSNTGTDVQTACNTFTWIDGNTYTSSNNTATHTLTNVAGCDSVVTLNLTINSVADITTTLNGLSISANNTNASYQWLDCDNNFAMINGETSQIFAAITNGNYAVELTENGCVDTSACVSISTVGIIDNNFESAVKLFPNPTNGSFSIDLGTMFETIEISITDITGKLILSKTFNTTQILNLFIEEPAGIYFVNVYSNEMNTVIKLIKE